MKLLGIKFLTCPFLKIQLIYLFDEMELSNVIFVGSETVRKKLHSPILKFCFRVKNPIILHNNMNILERWPDFLFLSYIFKISCQIHQSVLFSLYS